ncbi:type III pantothenate kinase [Flavobacterium gilvum]|uniref:Type III pantothenate kinase n=1 Tax=Flavobacterium gilvum TaxID=1492737 RepID=A0AAC9N4U6_9FLAO|nr:type III pantothenate kinase [Flavobacterium gilvum]AOW08397.1 pantothenate kinase [Flavobacterium gilvum]KFC58319.1 pantothenate kinase [Flavobacterium gilvum]
MVLAIDVGNTRIKGAVFENDNTLGFFVFPKEKIQKEIENILKKYPSVKHLIVASVGKADKDLFLNFKNVLDLWFISHEDFFPFTNNYATPKTLGIDRMVLAAGATLKFPRQNRLIIDAGTCVTYDFVDQNDVYHGGAISPGLRLRYESLHNFTEKLPLLTVDNPKHFIGDSTAEAIHSGIVNGLVYEINGFVDEYLSKFPNFIIILTGGDANFLAMRLKNTIFANSNFLLESLNQIFQYKIGK